MIRRRAIAVAVGLVLLSPTLSVAARAQEKALIPSLGEHTFVPNSLVRSPLIRSYFRSTTGVGGTSRLVVPAVSLPDGTVLFDLATELTLATLAFEFEYAMKPWVAVWGNFEVLGRLGTSTEALISEGITGAASFELGWQFKLWQDERNALSLELASQRRNGAFINVLDWLERILEDGGFQPGNSLVRSRDSMRGLAGLDYAHAFSPLLGVTADAALGYGERLDRQGDNDFSHEFALGVSCNLSATTRVPLGLFLGYAFSDVRQGGLHDLGNSSTVGLRIDYMGFEDFVIGLEGSVSKAPVVGLSEDLESLGMEIDLQYWF